MALFWSSSSSSSLRGSLKIICTRCTRSPLAVDQDGERLADRAQPEVVLGVELAGAVEAVEERRELEHLHAVLHEVLGDQLTLS